VYPIGRHDRGEDARVQRQECLESLSLAEHVDGLFTSEAIQLHGGFGFTDEFAVSRLYHGARYGTLGGGTFIGKRIMDAADTGAELLAYDMTSGADLAVSHHSTD
jgi:alkylation response protein AidB-like acyl-CoA dehydrogenase